MSGDHQSIRQLLDKIEPMIQIFMTTAEFQALSPIEKSLAHSIITLITRVIHHKTGKTPNEWDSLNIIEALLELFPNPSAHNLNFYRAVKPVLSAFLGYLRREGLMLNSREILTALNSPEN